MPFLRKAETASGAIAVQAGRAERGPWKTVVDIKLETLGWVYWHNTQRLHGYLGDVPPADYEHVFYAQQADRQTLVRDL